MTRCKLFVLIFFVFFVSVNSNSQIDFQIEPNFMNDVKVNFYTFKFKSVDNQFYNLEASLIGEFDNHKPLMFYIEGSSRSPSFILNNDNQIQYFGANEILKFTEYYNFVILGKPAIPIKLHVNKLDENNLYLDSLGNIPSAYTLNNNLDQYIKTYNTIIDTLCNLNYNKRSFVMGHSQGARIALELHANSNIKGIVYMSCDPLGRFASEFDNTDQNDVERYEFYCQALSYGNNDLNCLLRNDTYYTWQSFAKPSILTMNTIEKPILITFGDQDKSCPNCYIFDIIPIYLKNIEVIKFENLDHNYFDNEMNRNFNKVYDQIITWSLKQ
jgi:hypothetical protein